MVANPLVAARRRSRTEPDPSKRVCNTGRDSVLFDYTYLMSGLTRRHYQGYGILPSTQVANARLRRLFDAGYLRRFFVPTGAFATEAVYTIGPAAIPVIAASLGIDRAEVAWASRRGAPRFLEHALAVADVRLACERDARALGYGLEWLSEPEARHEYTIGTRSERHILKPDGAIVLENGSGCRVFLIEVDRGHVSSAQFQRSCASYRRYLELGLAREVYETDAVSVICITTGGERRIAHLADAAAKEALTVRFASWRDFAASGPFGAIWRTRSTDEPARLVREVRG